jgi:hypothetical protein
MDFNERVLASAGTAWDGWLPWPEGWHGSPAATALREELPPLLRAEYGDASLFVLKDPRICRFLPLWSEALAGEGIDVGCVLCLRDPFEVARSLESRDGMGREESLVAWLRALLDAERDSRGLARQVVAYPALLSDWRREVAAIAGRLGFAWPRTIEAAGAEVDAFLTRSLRHHYAEAPAGIQPGMVRLAKAAHAALQALALEPDDPAARLALDAIRVEFDTAASRLGPLAAELQARAERAERKARRASALEAQVDRQANEIAALIRRLAGAESATDAAGATTEPHDITATMAGPAQEEDQG